jgi:hypothetical protein
MTTFVRLHCSSCGERVGRVDEHADGLVLHRRGPSTQGHMSVPVPDPRRSGRQNIGEKTVWRCRRDRCGRTIALYGPEIADALDVFDRTGKIQHLRVPV